MRERAKPAFEEAASEWMREGLHELCQPLMALECQLFLALQEVEKHGPGSVSLQRETFEAGLHKCTRMIGMVRAAQTRLAATDEGGR